MRGQTLDDVVDRDVRGTAHEDAKIALDELEDELDEGVGFACLRTSRQLPFNPYLLVEEDPRPEDHV